MSTHGKVGLAFFQVSLRSISAFTLHYDITLPVDPIEHLCEHALCVSDSCLDTVIDLEPMLPLSNKNTVGFFQTNVFFYQTMKDSWSLCL